MSVKHPEFVLRHRVTGAVFGLSPLLEDDIQLEKVRYADVYPEKCMPEHIEKKVKSTAKKKTNTKKKAKPKLDLVTDNIPDDPDEILDDDLDDAIAEALGEDASRGLDD
jgi:hypothetical protein